MLLVRLAKTQNLQVGKQCKYLYRSVGKEGNTIEFMLSAKRAVSAATRFFKKMM
jgi:transposase-like protein